MPKFPLAPDRGDTIRPVNRARSLLLITVAYLVAIAVAWMWLWAGPDTGSLLLDTLLADLIGTAVIFGFSRAYRNSSVYDAYWSVAPPLLFVYWWLHAEDPDVFRAVLIAIVVAVWSIRLTSNWLVGFPGLDHEDWRYEMIRSNAGRAAILADLFAIHVIPTLQVFLGMVPVYIALTTPGPGWVWLTVIAGVVGLAAVALEAVADRQMRTFRIDHPGQVMVRGVWAWSRHPNYFGELGFWISLALFGVAASPSDAWWLFAGAVGMLAMFLGASIPWMEQRSRERRPDYDEQTRGISALVPWPPR